MTSRAPVIKTHGSVSCGPRSRRATPVSILTGRTKTQSSHLRSSVLLLNCYKKQTPYPIALTFGIEKGGIKAHLGTNISWNTINRQRVISDYSRKITPICCHAYRVNRVWKEAENQWVNRLTIEPQTFCGLKEIELKTRKIQRKNQPCVTITQSRLANKKTTTCQAYQINCLR